jgi:polyphosphate kinase
MAADGNGKKKKADKASRKKHKGRAPLPKVIRPDHDAPAIETRYGAFDLDDPVLPAWIDENALKSGGYPYDERIKDKLYEEELTQLQIELVKLQHDVIATGKRLLILFEGRDAAGKGGAIFTFDQYLNPRSARTIALPKPTDVEAGQWYFQRYLQYLPTAGEIVLFDRSWYNRAGVEAVMGFCSEPERSVFLDQAPKVERLLVEGGIVLFKFWLNVGRMMQLKRFHERRHNPLKIWKLSPIDYASLEKWGAYTRARDEMFAATHTSATPWTTVRANDRRRARLNIIRYVLDAMDYAGKDAKVVRQPDPLIIAAGPELLGEE